MNLSTTWYKSIAGAMIWALSLSSVASADEMAGFSKSLEGFSQSVARAPFHAAEEFLREVERAGGRRSQKTGRPEEKSASLYNLTPAPVYRPSDDPWRPSSIPPAEKENLAAAGEEKTLFGGRVQMSGRYRLGMGVDGSQDVIVNNANADLQDFNFRYISGERLANTFDPAIYSQYLLNLDYAPTDRVKIHTQIVADPWSWVGTSGEQVLQSDVGTSFIRYNLKYFGASDSTLNEIIRANTGDSVALPLIKVSGNQTKPTTAKGFFDFNPATGGLPYTIPETDIDFEFRPFRELWVDLEREQWHARVFFFADESQALTSDDPLGLSNHKDYWQQSPWLYQYEPIRFFTDGSIKRGFYSDNLSFLARDSEGNRLVLLRGASLEGFVDKTYFAATVAAPYTPWDEDYFEFDNIPAAIRVKHRATDDLTVGATYTFRSGLVNNSIADINHVLGIDAAYKLNEHVTLKGEVAGSHREKERLNDQTLETSTEGLAYKAEMDVAFDHRTRLPGSTRFHLSATWMDENFEPLLSRYSNTRDDHFWGNHLSFIEYPPELEYFRIGDGADINRFVVRAQWEEKLFEERFINLMDFRTVFRASDADHKETVFREEMTYKINPQWTAKGLFRWQGLPKTTAGVEPFLANIYIADEPDPVFQNSAIPEGEDPSRFTYSGGLQYKMSHQWTAEGVYEYSNNIPDFPRGLLNSSFRDANQVVNGHLEDKITNLLFGQSALGGVPPYDYFHILRERIVFKPNEQWTLTFHAAQNGYKFAGGIDDNINHQGVSIHYQASERLSFFFDYTHSKQIDIPKLIATNYGEFDFESHHNVYFNVEYRLNSSMLLRAEYGVFGLGIDTPLATPYSTSTFSLPTIDTEHIFRVSLTGEF